MLYNFCLIFSFISIFTSICLALIFDKRKTGKIIKPITIILGGVSLSAVLLFIPVYYNIVRSSGGSFTVLMSSIYSVIRLFIVEGDFEVVAENLGISSPLLTKIYFAFTSIIFILIPTLTLGCVITFFKNIAAKWQYIMHFNSEIYIFSTINEKTIALAEDLCKNSKKRFIVFGNVNDEINQDFVSRAYKIRAACFEKEITSVNFLRHNKSKKINFFLLSSDETNNISQALLLIEGYKNRKHTSIYVLSTKFDGELILSNVARNCDYKHGIKIYRINEVRALINHILYNQGYQKIFASSYKEDGVKRINALVIGMGQHGTEMTKALAWVCQMDGYLACIESFDITPDAAEKFEASCPELVKYSGSINNDFETKYSINIHSNIDVNSIKFNNIIDALPQATYIFVALGNDELNITTAARLRMLYARKGHYPEIQAVVYDSDKNSALDNLCNHNGEKYNIDFIGSLNKLYTEEVILNSELEAAALARHKKWGEEADFWRFDYNYKSSVASVIHQKIKKLCSVKGADKLPSERTEEEKTTLRVLEHRRWNAYIRSEGYVYGGTTDKSGRDDMAKLHNCLVPFDQLPLSEQIKDDD